MVSFIAVQTGQHLLKYDYYVNNIFDKYMFLYPMLSGTASDSPALLCWMAFASVIFFVAHKYAISVLCAI